MRKITKAFLIINLFAFLCTGCSLFGGSGSKTTYNVRFNMGKVQRDIVDPKYQGFGYKVTFVKEPGYKKNVSFARIRSMFRGPLISEAIFRPRMRLRFFILM